MEKERIQLEKNTRTIQQRSAGSASIVDNRLGILSGSSLQRVEDDEEVVLQGKMKGAVQRIGEADVKGNTPVVQGKKGELNSYKNVTQRFTEEELAKENKTVISALRTKLYDVHAFWVRSKTARFTPFEILHVSSSKFDPSKAGKRVRLAQVRKGPFTTLFYNAAHKIYAVGAHVSSSSYVIQRVDVSITDNPFVVGEVVSLNHDFELP